jgi:hypothetical protein
MGFSNLTDKIISNSHYKKYKTPLKPIKVQGAIIFKIILRCSTQDLQILLLYILSAFRLYNASQTACIGRSRRRCTVALRLLCVRLSADGSYSLLIENLNAVFLVIDLLYYITSFIKSQEFFLVKSHVLKIVCRERTVTVPLCDSMGLYQCFCMVQPCDTCQQNYIH